MELPKCLNCGITFEKRTTWQKFCSSNCRNIWHSLHKADKVTVIIDKSGGEKNLPNGKNNA